LLVHIGDLLRIRPPLLNHKRFDRFNKIPDGHLEFTNLLPMRQPSAQRRN
jgi:hypothetical protein